MEWIQRLLPWAVLTAIVAIGVMAIFAVILSIALPKAQTKAPGQAQSQLTSPDAIADTLPIDELIQRESRLKRNVFLGIIGILAILFTASVMWGQIDIQT